MHKNKALSYTTFGLLYFSQGTILGYFASLNSIYLQSKGLTMTDIGIFAAIALLPFVLKIFFGMLSDSVNLLGMGHRRPYILIGLLIQASCLVVTPFIDPSRYFWGFVGIAFLLQMGMALYDTCTDGLALDTIAEQEQSTIQGFMVGGRAFGVIISAAVAGLLAEKVSWTAVFWMLALISLLPIPLVWRAREAKRTKGQAFEWAAFGALLRKDILILCALGFVFFLIIAGANQNVNPFIKKEFGIQLSTAGFLTTLWGIGVVCGSTLGATLMRRIGREKTTWLAIAISMASLWALAATPNVTIIWPVNFIFGISYGLYQTLYFALAMNYTHTHIAASMYAILMAASNVALGAGMAISGILADSDSIGFRWTFVILSGFNLLAIPLTLMLFKKKPSTDSQ